MRVLRCSQRCYQGFLSLGILKHSNIRWSPPFPRHEKYAVEVKLHSFYTSALAGNEWDGSDILVSLYPQMNLKGLEKNNLLPLMGFEHRYVGPYSIHHTDWAIQDSEILINKIRYHSRYHWTCLLFGIHITYSALYSQIFSKYVNIFMCLFTSLEFLVSQMFLIAMN